MVIESHQNGGPEPAGGGASASGVDPTTGAGPLRIRVVSELTGVPEPTLRAWERRYGVPVPERTSSGYRLYGAEEVEQVRRMRRLCDDGMSASEAARLILAGPAKLRQADVDPYVATVEAILAAVERFDDLALDLELRRAMFLGPSATLVERILVPAIVRIGELWHAGLLTIAEEHFASQRLGTMMRDLLRLATPDGLEERSVVACFADEDHELGALAFAMRLAGWGLRPTFLGARTPPSAIKTIVRGVAPKLVALSVTMPPPRARARELLDGYAGACGDVPWFVGGAGAEAIGDLVTKAGGRLAPSEPGALRLAVRDASVVRPAAAGASRRKMRVAR